MTCIALMLSLCMTALQRTMNCPPYSRYRPLCPYLSEPLYSKILYRIITFTRSAHSYFSSFTFLLIYICKNKVFQQQFAHLGEGKQKHICFSRYHTDVLPAHVASQLFYTIRNVIETISSILMNSMCHFSFFSWKKMSII